MEQFFNIQKFKKFIKNDIIKLEIGKNIIKHFYKWQDYISIKQENLNNNYFGNIIYNNKNIPIFINQKLNDNLIIIFYNNYIKLVDINNNYTENFKINKTINNELYQYINQTYLDNTELKNYLNQNNLIKTNNICKMCLINYAVVNNGIFKYNGQVEEKNIYCKECSKEITNYFLNLKKDEQQDKSYYIISKIIEKIYQQKGIIIADSYFHSEEDIEKMQNKIKYMLNNIKQLQE